MNKAQIQMKKAKQKGLSPLELAQMKAIAKKEADRMVQEAEERAFVMLLALPAMVLENDYWNKSAKKRIPRFIGDVASLYESYKMGCVTDDDIMEFLRDWAGIDIEAEWNKKKVNDNG